MGEVFKMTNANYRKYLTAVAGGDQNADLENFGAKFVCAPDNVTDITPDWAESLLETEKGVK
jgi:hypothetical protein